MSLLMEALRKAEQAKRRMQQEEAAARGEASGDPFTPPSSLALEEREPGVTPQYIRENFTAQDPDADAALPAELLDESVAYPDEASEHARHLAQRQRAAAASVFAAKRKPARSRKTLAILVTLLLLIVPIGGGILWYLQSANSSSIGLNPALANYDLSSRRFDDNDTTAAEPGVDSVAAATTVAETNTDTNADTSTTANADANNAAALATAAGGGNTRLADTRDEVATTPASATDAAPAQPEQDAGLVTTAAPQAPAAAPTPAAAANANLALPANASGPVLEISRSRGTPQVNPDISAAYARLQEGDLTGAGSLYRQVLASLPNNRDALLGLALVHMREGQVANARALYARLLELNPRDPLAHTGLLQTMQSGSPTEHENALKALIAEFPNVAQLTLALGNHYAAQGRWSEAQAAYYNALLAARRGANGPVHPDYAFNLAVSLEQLNQPQAALDYYRQAQALAADLTPGFDMKLLNSRLDYLLSGQAPR